MPAVQELLVNLFVATPAIPRGQADRRNRESMMIFLLLTRCCLVTIQTVHAFLCMLAHFVFVNDRVLGSRVTLGALTRRSHQFASRLFSFNFRASTV
jgi:hypothetical protein